MHAAAALARRGDGPRALRRRRRGRPPPQHGRGAAVGSRRREGRAAAAPAGPRGERRARGAARRPGQPRARGLRRAGVGRGAAARLAQPPARAPRGRGQRHPRAGRRGRRPVRRHRDHPLRDGHGRPHPQQRLLSRPPPSVHAGEPAPGRGRCERRELARLPHAEGVRALHKGEQAGVGGSARRPRCRGRTRPSRRLFPASRPVALRRTPLPRAVVPACSRTEVGARAAPRSVGSASRCS